VTAIAGFVSGTSLDEFLGRNSNADAERVRDIGAAMSTIGLLLALGVVVYLAAVHRGTRSEVRSLVLTAALGGVAALSGAMAELAGIQAVFETGWSQVLSVDVSSSAMMRALAGAMIVFGLDDAAVAVGDAALVDRAGERPVRWQAGADSAFGLAGLAIGVLSFAFDGHTVTEGPRWAHLLSDALHVTAGGAWFGGVVALVIVAVIRHRSLGALDGLRAERGIDELIVRFSSVATVSLLAVAGAGLLLAGFILDDVGEITGTVWGRRLTIKLVAVAVAVAIGAYHHVVTVPRLESGDHDPGLAARTRTTLVLEAIVLTFVVVATTFVVNGSIT
jgi:copper transport protein